MHLSTSRLKLLNNRDSNIISSNTDKIACDVCHFAKQRKLSFPLSTSSTDSCFDLIHIDIWGPINVKSFNGFRYFLTIVDDFSRYTWIFFMKHKSEARVLIKSFFTFVQTQFNTTIKILRSDNGLEFKIPEFYKSLGTIHQTTCVYTPQ